VLKVAIKGVLARKLRLLLTSIAVVLGVGFVSGAFFLTDSLRDSFDTVFTEAAEGIDVQVQTKEYKELATQQATSQPGSVSIDLERVGVPPETLDRISELDGVAKAVGTVFEIGAQPLDKDGAPISTGGAPTFGSNWVPEASDIGALRIVEGEAPGRGEVLLDATSMDRGEFEIGDDVTILAQGGRERREFEIVGVIQFGDSNSLNGAAISAFETTEAQELFAMGDRYTSVSVQAEDGVSQRVLKRTIQRELGPTYDVITGEEFTQEQTEAIDGAFLDILQNVILGFAAIAVFVGAFTIFNTFTILVGQRTREFGLLRAIGAGRAQILGIVTLEALVTGIVASTLGILAGFGIATLLRELINSLGGGGIPEAPFPLRSRTIIAAYLVGVVVTLVASVIPAWRASRLSPLEALRSNPALAGRGWRAPSTGAAFVFVGSLLVGWGFSIEEASVQRVLALIGGGFAVAIIGIALLSRLFIPFVTHVLAPLLARGTMGSLASRNVLRNRARSATTASALMIGLALASLVLVFQASLRQTIEAELDRTLGADITIYNSTVLQTGQGSIDDKLFEQIGGVDGVDELTAQRYGGASIGDEFDAKESQIITAIDEAALTTAGHVRLVITDGDEVPGDGVLVNTDTAKEEGWAVGDEVELAFATDQSRTFTVTGIFEPNQFVGAPVIMPVDDFLELQPPAARSVAFAYASVDPDAGAREVSKAIRKELGRDAASLEIQDTEQLRAVFDEQLAPVLGLVFGMLSLSLIIALFGIGNTMALNVFERTREIGLIRAVGGTQRQIRRVIRVESVLVAVFGAIVGVLVGVGAGFALIAALKDEGFEFAVSIPPLVAVLLAGFLAGVLASVLPARRAARTDVLQAIATE
jgi:putative ABC transport system permease protein